MELKSNMDEQEVIMYLQRAVEKTILKAELQTKAILITGARQVGKSTTIKELYPDYTYITLSLMFTRK